MSKVLIQPSIKTHLVNEVVIEQLGEGRLDGKRSAGCSGLKDAQAFDKTAQNHFIFGRF